MLAESKSLGARSQTEYTRDARVLPGRALAKESRRADATFAHSGSASAGRSRRVLGRLRRKKVKMSRFPAARRRQSGGKPGPKQMELQGPADKVRRMAMDAAMGGTGLGLACWMEGGIRLRPAWLAGDTRAD